MATRLRDIANDLNLSAMTISKVLRGQTDVSAATRERVLRRAQELNYQPNVTARNLRTGQTHSVGMMVPALQQPGVAEMMRGAAEVCRAAGFGLVLSSTEGASDEQEREVGLHLARQVDCLLVCLQEDATGVPPALNHSSVPFVVVGYCPSRMAAFTVDVDHVSVGRLAAEHLLARQCKRIACLRGPRTAVGDLRFSGFLQAMRATGVAVRMEWVAEIAPGMTEYRNTFAAVTGWMSGRPRPDGIVASSDVLAAAARDAALAAGLNLPRKVQVIGMGNRQDLCQMGLTLSSVDLQFAEVGRRAARLALRLTQRQDGSSVRSGLVAPVAVQRDSTRRIG